MPVLKTSVIEKFKELRNNEKSKKMIGTNKANKNIIRRVSVLKTKGSLNSTTNQENVQKLIQQ